MRTGEKCAYSCLVLSTSATRCCAGAGALVLSVSVSVSVSVTGSGVGGIIAMYHPASCVRYEDAAVPCMLIWCCPCIVLDVGPNKLASSLLRFLASSSICCSPGVYLDAPRRGVRALYNTRTLAMCVRPRVDRHRIALLPMSMPARKVQGRIRGSPHTY